MRKYFAGLTTMEEIKKAYKKLAFELHPDKGGSTAEMQELNNQYEQAISYYGKAEDHQTNKEYMDIIADLINLDGIEIEICGSWIWITGDTYPHRDVLKKLHFKYSKNKTAWYLAGEPSKNKKKMTLDEIRNLHGSKQIKGNGNSKILIGA